MAFLPPDTHPLWKDQLRTGVIESATAAAVGNTLGRIHAATADRPDIAARFPTDQLFAALRLEPYLAATAQAHPDLARALDALIATTRTTKRVLVHGDFSPKNLLIGSAGPAAGRQWGRRPGSTLLGRTPKGLGGVCGARQPSTGEQYPLRSRMSERPGHE